MKKKLLALLMGTSLVLAACGGGGDEATEPKEEAETTPTEETETETGDTGAVNVAAAEDVYKQSCAGCHGGNLEGGFGPQLEDIGSKLSQADIEDIIANGQGSMSGGIITGDDAVNVAAWLAEKK
ncbi:MULTISPECIES: cytochrome c551 [Bacillaceae]|uniref:cytochrome c551 n=1 Tax=Bacillaceae TaxID=186817 RepID=UPI001BDE50C9|nr:MULTISPECIES: cytochrome c [Bacillaceae]MDX8360582.1 cytochrome c [Cytobacillus sp. IB215316]